MWCVGAGFIWKLKMGSVIQRTPMKYITLINTEKYRLLIIFCKFMWYYVLGDHDIWIDWLYPSSHRGLWLPDVGECVRLVDGWIVDGLYSYRGSHHDLQIWCKATSVPSSWLQFFCVLWSPISCPRKSLSLLVHSTSKTKIRIKFEYSTGQTCICNARCSAVCSVELKMT